MKTVTRTLMVAITAMLGMATLLSAVHWDDGDALSRSSYIVQGQSLALARDAAADAGGRITHELGVIRAVAADLSDRQAAALRKRDGVTRLWGNASIEVAGKPDKSGGTNSNSYTVQDTFYASLVNADTAHAAGITGAGIGIAVLDTGLYKHEGIKNDKNGNVRLLALYDAILDDEQHPQSGDDPGGHGTHVASLAVSSLVTDNGLYNGIAPDAKLISVRAFDQHGQGTYADVIRAIDWVVANRKRHKIHILNLSFSAEPKSHYWDDPLNQAVMEAWRSEVFVVAAAGNRGPGAMTIGVPGNVPYVMTVGAMTDNYTPADGSDDKLASFSSAGPTYEGFVKPEVVAPGGHMRGLVDARSELATTYPEYFVDELYFEMSGTSQATAVVSGIAALALQAEEWRSVDELKCKIMSAAKPALTDGGELAYSVFQQGAGLVDAYAAVLNQTTDCANNGLHIDNDIDGYQHFGGRANQMPVEGTTQDVVRDEFTTSDYSNNDGSAVWTGSWVEYNDDASPVAGTVRIENSRLRLDNSDSDTFESISRSADLSGANSATLSFDFGGYGAGGLDIVLVEASDDGGATFVKLEPLEVVGTPTGSRSYNLHDFISLSDQVVLRFRLYQGFMGAGQYVDFDNVQIEYGGQGSGSGDYYLMGLDGYTWTDGFMWTDGFVWTDGYVWTDGFVWTDSYMWTDSDVGMNGYVWTDGFVWTDGYVWTDSLAWMDGYVWTDALTEMATMAGWVEPE